MKSDNKLKCWTSNYWVVQILHTETFISYVDVSAMLLLFWNKTGQWIMTVCSLLKHLMANWSCSTECYCRNVSFTI